MDIITNNMISLLAFAIDRREKEEKAEVGPNFESGELAAWRIYLQQIEDGDRSIHLTKQ